MSDEDFKLLILIIGIFAIIPGFFVWRCAKKRTEKIILIQIFISMVVVFLYKIQIYETVLSPWNEIIYWGMILVSVCLLVVRLD